MDTYSETSELDEQINSLPRDTEPVAPEDPKIAQLKADMHREILELAEKYSMVKDIVFWELVDSVIEPCEADKKLLANWKIEQDAIEMRYKILAGQA